MDEMQNTPEGGEQKNKFGLVAAIVALVAVVALGSLAYRVLLPAMQPQQDAPSAQDAAGQPDDASAGSGASSSADIPGAQDVFLEDLDCRLVTEDGEVVWLASIAEGRPLVVNFWATWCPYCVQEMDDFQAIYDDYSGSVAFAFVDYADGARETVRQASEWLEANGYSLPAYYDVDSDAVDTFAVTGFPTTVVFAADGRVVYAASGPIDADYQRGLLNTLLGA